MPAARPPRFALLVPTLATGGIGQTVVALANRLVAAHPVDLLLSADHGPHLKRLDPAVRLVHLPTTNRLTGWLPLAWYLYRERPAALLTHIERTSALALQARRVARVPVRLCSTLHTHLGSFIAQLRPGKRDRHTALMRRCYPACDALIAVSNAVAEDAAARLDLARERIRVIHNPLLPDDLDAQAQAVPGHPWMQPGEPPVLLAVGRLEPVKDFPALLAAFAQLRRTRRCRLVILGEGKQREALLARAAMLGIGADLLLPGFVDNPYAWMRRAAALVSSSRCEGFGNVLVEALACGTPVVATACPGGPEEILDGGRLGPLVPVGDAAALAAALAATLDRPLPAAVLRAGAERYSAARSAERYRAVLLGHPLPEKPAA